MNMLFRGTFSLFFFIFFITHKEFSFSAFLRQGSPLKWLSSKPHLNYIRHSGVEQFIHHYHRSRNIQSSTFLWGDEIEYGVFKKDYSNGCYDLALRAKEIREKLSFEEKKQLDMPIGCEWQPEYGAWMVEAVPRNPYGSQVRDLFNVEKNMQLRRKRLHFALSDDELAPTISTFPMLGVHGYNHTVQKLGNLSNSKLVSDAIINPHPRFGALTYNIRSRRNRNVQISIPKDTSEDTPMSLMSKPGIAQTTWSLLKKTIRDIVSSFLPSTHISQYETARIVNSSLPANANGSIVMDAMAFGMGCCCLQITMQCKSESESRYLHDQLATLCPLLQTLSASSPLFNGHLAGVDSRWDVISQAVDDRTAVESGEISDAATVNASQDGLLAGKGVRRLSKSRYGTISSYLAHPDSDEQLQRIQQLNDIDVETDPEYLDMLLQNGIDPVLAKHIAHLFVRDPLVIFDDAIRIDNLNSLDHFENIQSTNWRSMRWKPPSLKVGQECSKWKRMHHKDEFNANLFGVDVEHLDHNILMEDRYEQTDSAYNLTRNDVRNVTDLHSSTSGVLANLSVLRSELPETDEVYQIGPGWRVEFRPLEVQLTDFENAAYAIFVVLLTRILQSNPSLNLYLPISKVEENMRRAQMKDAVIHQKFWFRTNCLEHNTSNGLVPSMEQIDLQELSLDEIINGQKHKPQWNPLGLFGIQPKNRKHKRPPFPGLANVVLEYLRVHEEQTHCSDIYSRLQPYIHLIQQRAKGKIPTAARWIRQFVMQHKDYQRDGRLTPTIANELLETCENIGMGRTQAPDLYGSSPRVLNLDRVDEEDLMYTNFTQIPQQMKH